MRLGVRVGGGGVEQMDGAKRVRTKKIKVNKRLETSGDGGRGRGRKRTFPKGFSPASVRAPSGG